MYNFIFWFFYRYFEWRDKYKSPFIATSMVGLALGIHFFAFYSVIRFFGGRRIGVLSENYTYNKLLMLPFAVLLFFLLYVLYYRRKADDILESFGERKPFTVKNISLVVLIIVVPLVLGIFITNMAVKSGL